MIRKTVAGLILLEGFYALVYAFIRWRGQEYFTHEDSTFERILGISTIVAIAILCIVGSVVLFSEPGRFRHRHRTVTLLSIVSVINLVALFIDINELLEGGWSKTQVVLFFLSSSRSSS